LVAFSGAEALCIRSPAFAIVRLRVGGLLQCGLKRVTDVRTEIDGLMKSENVFLFYRERGLIAGVVVLGLKIWNESEDALGVVVLLAGGIRWGA